MFLNVHDVIVGANERLVVLDILPKEQGFTVSPVGDISAGGSVRFMRFSELAVDIDQGLRLVEGADSRFVPNKQNEEGSVAAAVEIIRKKLIKRVNDLCSRGLTISQAVEQIRAEGPIVHQNRVHKIPSVRSVYRLLGKRRDGQSLSRLDHLKGNRQPRYSEAVVEFVVNRAKRLYYQDFSRFTLKSLTSNLNTTAPVGFFNAANPKSKIGIKAVRSILLARVSSDLDHKRLDPRFAKAIKAVAANRIRPGALLSRIEMDTVHLPLACKTPWGISTDLRLMIAIECSSSVIVGWVLMVGAPDVETTLSCVERIVRSKAGHFQRLRINSDIDPFGTPLLLVTDNGSENVSERIDMLTRVCIDVERCPINSPNYKPFVERFNRSIKEALETLPGSTRFNGVDGARPVEVACADPLMSMEEVERWVVRFMFEKWIHQELDRFVTADYELREDHGITPYQRWKNLSFEQPLPLPPSPQAWANVRFLRTSRCVSAKTGVSLEGFDFRGDGLREVIKEFGPDQRVTVLWNPSDYRYILVLKKDGVTQVKLINAEVRETTPAYSFKEAKQRRKEQKLLSTQGHAAADQFDSDIATASMAGTTKSRKEKSKEVSKQSKAHKASTKARNDPLPKTVAVAEPEQPTPDHHITEDSIPDLAVASTHRTPI